jgi:hypothetical protein
MSSIKYKVGCLMTSAGIISFILIIPGALGYAQPDDGFLTPTFPVPTLYFPDPEGLGFLFACPDKIVTGPGPTWQGITIGVSKIQNLEAIFGKSDKVTITASTSASDQISYGDILVGCVQNGIIVTLRSGPELPFLSDFVAVYGPPDVVTWTPTYNLRVAFWFEEGIAVES